MEAQEAEAWEKAAAEEAAKEKARQEDAQDNVPLWQRKRKATTDPQGALSLLLRKDLPERTRSQSRAHFSSAGQLRVWFPYCPGKCFRRRFVCGGGIDF